MKMVRIEKPWGEEEIIVDTPNYRIKIIHVKAGCRLSKQYHNEKEET
jgi:mannose-6-phosphate isomerase